MFHRRKNEREGKKEFVDCEIRNFSFLFFSFTHFNSSSILQTLLENTLAFYIRT